MDGVVFNMATKLDKTLHTATLNMCSDKCPCYAEAAAYDKYDEIEEEVYNSFGRTKVGMCIKTEDSVRREYVKDY